MGWIQIGLYVVLLVLLKHKWPSWDVYRLLAWLYEVFPSLVPK